MVCPPSHPYQDGQEAMHECEDLCVRLGGGRGEGGKILERALC